jgi:hypothetical protein
MFCVTKLICEFITVGAGFSLRRIAIKKTQAKACAYQIKKQKIRIIHQRCVHKHVIKKIRRSGILVKSICCLFLKNYVYY